VDLYFVGRLGAEAIAGVAMSSTIIFVLATFIVGLVYNYRMYLKALWCTGAAAGNVSRCK
jgi:uncharacterized membrane protein